MMVPFSRSTELLQIQIKNALPSIFIDLFGTFYLDFGYVKLLNIQNCDTHVKQLRIRAPLPPSVMSVVAQPLKVVIWHG